MSSPVSVLEATHDFLQAEDCAAISEQVRSYVATLELWSEKKAGLEKHGSCLSLGSSSFSLQSFPEVVMGW